MSAVDDKYAWLSTNVVAIGEPIGPEVVSTDLVGRLRNYEFGTIYWHPRVGAFEVHGAIRDRYWQLGGERGELGYPTSDEADLPDGSGRFNDFEFGRGSWLSANGTVDVLNTSTFGLSRVEDYIAAVEWAEAVYAGDTPEQLLTRLRQQYYPDPAREGWGPWESIKFETLIPDASSRDGLLLRRLSRSTVGDATFDLLTARADENGSQDNPSPYLIDNLRRQVDVGHVLLTLDALVHPRTTSPYSNYSVPSIDPANWVADLGLAGFWTSTHERDGQPKDAPLMLPAATFDGYYRMSAPDSDLFGDADGFGLHAAWTAVSGQKLSQAMRRYYLPDGDSLPGYLSRWRTFCSVNQLTFAFDLDTGTIDWDDGIGDQWIQRINRICDLFNDGWTAVLPMLIDPTLTDIARGSWPYAGTAFSTFRDWLAAQLVTEFTP